MARILPLQKARGQFEFADDGAAEVAGLHQLGRVERNAGADDDEVLAAEGQQAVTAGFDVDALFQQRGNVFGQGFGAADVGDGDLGAVAAQKDSRGQAGFAQSDDENFFAFEFHHGVIPVRASLLCTVRVGTREAGDLNSAGRIGGFRAGSGNLRCETSAVSGW